MKTYYTLSIFLLLFVSGVAQNLQKNYINYKGLAADAIGNPLATTTINLQIALRFGDVNALASYIENHSVMTDENGIFSIQIGTGVLVGGAYNPENFGTNASYITVTINGVDTGTTELMAVPYAISAGNTHWEKNGNDITNTNTGNVVIDGDVSVDGTLKFNTDQNIGSGDFIFKSLNQIGFGGMYIDSPDTATGLPFYGYAIDGIGTAFHFYDTLDRSWKLNVGFSEPLKITDDGNTYINGKIAINANNQINSVTDFTLSSLNSTGFGGMYINSPDTSGGKPFYGYSINGTEVAFHYYDAQDSSWKLAVGFEEVLKITELDGMMVNGTTNTTSINDLSPDLILGGTSNTVSGDDGIISSDPAYTSSDIILRSNDLVSVQLDRDNNENGEFEIRNGSNSVVFEVNESGTIRQNGSTIHASDRRLKKDIETLSYGLAEILKLQPKAYHWKKGDQNHKSLGLIAQEVQPIISEVVVAQDDAMQTLGVSYTELIPVLINAIKEQQNEITSLKLNIKNKDVALTEILHRVNTLENAIFNK